MLQTTTLPRSTPEAEGVPSAAIMAFLDAAERDLDALHSVMVLRHGRVIAEGWWEPYRADDRHMLFSLSKSFTSTAIGLLVAEGRLSVDDPVLDFFPDEAPPRPSDHLRAMRVHHLLAMTTGHAVDTTVAMTDPAHGSWTRGVLAQPVEHAPGTFFCYNSGASYLLSAIVQRLTGGRMRDYLQPRLFAPLRIDTPRWDTSPQGIDTGGWGLWLTTAEIAAFGQLYLQGGVWEGTRLLSADWVAAATAHQARNDPAPNPDWAQGYGYQFWRARHGAYRGDGAFGQFCIVIPERDAVVVTTAGLGEMQPVLDRIWAHLLPALGDAPLPADAGAQSALADRLARLELRGPAGAARTATAARVSGRTFAMDENPEGIAALRFDFADDGATLTVAHARGEERIALGHGAWRRGATRLVPRDSSNRPAAPRQTGTWPIAGRGAWADDATYVAKLWWHETPFARTLTCRFAGDDLTIEQRPNVGFGPTDTTRLTGRIG